jgi:hypothetical protein
MQIESEVDADNRKGAVQNSEDKIGHQALIIEYKREGGE